MKSANSSPHWSDSKERGSSVAFWGMKLMLGAHQLGGRPLFALVLYPVMAWFFVTSTAARRASRQYFTHLQQCHPELNLKPSLLLSWRHFLSFADVILDKFNAWSGTLTHDRVQCFGREKMLERLSAQQGGILLTAHLGNLEALQALSEHNSQLKLNVLVHTRHAEQFNRVLASRQRGTSIRLIQVEALDPALAATLSARVEAGEWLVIAADRVPVSQQDSRTLDVQFLGDTAPLPMGPHLLALLLGCPLVLVVCLKQAGNYRIYFETLADKLTADVSDRGMSRRAERQLCLQRSAQHYADRLAHYCQQAPLQWFNFYSFWRKHDSN